MNSNSNWFWNWNWSKEEFAIHLFGTISNITIVLFILGIINNQPTLILGLNYVLKIMISLYMIYKYNNFRKDNVQFTNLDRKLVYSLSVYILIISFADIILQYTVEIRQFFIQNYTSKLGLGNGGWASGGWTSGGWTSGNVGKWTE